VEEPGADHRASAPQLRDRRDVELVLVELGMLKGCGLSVLLALTKTDVCALEDGETFGVGRHDPVLDAVVDHLHEVAGACRTAVQIAVFGLDALALASDGPRCGIDTGSEGCEHGLEASEGFVVAADHEAVAAIESEDAAARAHVDVVDAGTRELVGTA